MSLGHQIGIFRYDSASVESDKFEKIGRIVSFSGLGLSAEVVDSTAFDEAAEDWNEYEYGMKDGGEYQIGIRYPASSAQADALETALMDSLTEQIKILFPAAYNKQIISSVLVTKVDFPTEKGGIKERTFTVKVTGKPAIGAST